MTEKAYAATRANGIAEDDAANPRNGLQVQRYFCPAGADPYASVEWEKRSAEIKGDDGQVIFCQPDVEVPATWSQLATNVVVSKYFYGENGKPEREASVRDLIDRVAGTIADWAEEDGVFATAEDARSFRDELAWLCVNQYGSFNSPVWFNVGLFHKRGIAGSEGNLHWDDRREGPVRTQRGYEFPQCSACFIQSVDDTMEDIMRLATSEAMLFKYGSGTGSDLSTLRSSQEKLAGGGTPSGPLSFMRVFDQVAGVVKSGGKTRRAAKMQSLRCDHPDILAFAGCKAREERKAWALIEQGYDGGLNGDAYSSVMYQNANLSVRVTDEFLEAAEEGADWQTYAVTTGEPLSRHKADEILRTMADSCHVCGDPGVQYHSTINRWNTCPASGTINASNPCSEYMFVNDSACNLASLNLIKFRRADGTFDVEAFRRAVRVFIIAQETLVDHASYPTERICDNSHRFRPLGLGYANLGAYLMSIGWPYDNDCGRATAAAVTAVMTGQAYATSAELAARKGCFDDFADNRPHMLRVIRMHRTAVDKIDAPRCAEELIAAARRTWDQALAAGEDHGYRNAQVSVLAPTGTIGFMMDCDTTGIEPDIALVKYKQLAGGGILKLVNRTVPMALERLGYTPDQTQEILDYVKEHDMIEGAPHLADQHLPVFDCAFKPAEGQRSIHYMGHLRMMAAVQPFLSGAISKTVNMPKDSSVDEIREVFLSGWKMGLKAVAIYRDGSKRAQPLNLKKSGKKEQKAPAEPATEPPAPAAAPRPGLYRRRMPTTSSSVRHKFDVGGHEGYIHVGLLEDGSPGEIFITMAKEGSTVGGMMDAFATAISLCLQYGVPLEALVKKFSHQRFEPSGMTDNSDIPFAKSTVDYIFRWLGITFLEDYRKANAVRRVSTAAEPPAKPASTGGVKDDSTPKPGADAAASKEVAAAGAGDKSPQASSPPRKQDADDGNGDGRKGQARSQAATVTLTETRSTRTRLSRLDQQFSHFQEDAPACDVCGSITVRNGNCYKCFNCGSSLGCS
jgi:ribonucleoside-diphosphate reductase alpha chain